MLNMDKHDEAVAAGDVDELWLADWAAEGIDALECYLVRQAAFARFLAERDGLGSGDGGRADEL